MIVNTFIQQYYVFMPMKQWDFILHHRVCLEYISSKKRWGSRGMAWGQKTLGSRKDISPQCIEILSLTLTISHSKFCLRCCFPHFTTKFSNQELWMPMQTEGKGRNQSLSICRTYSDPPYLQFTCASKGAWYSPTIWGGGGGGSLL